MAAKIAQIRATLRQERRAANLTLDTLSAASGVDRSVIHRIENVRRYRDYVPELDTMARLLGGLRLSWTEFFARVEGVEVAGLLALPEPVRQALLAMPSIGPPAPGTGGSKPATQAKDSSTALRRQRRPS